MVTENKKTRRKTYKEYLLQFFTLFFAILLGAIAENFREQYTAEVLERNMEKETLMAMINDLKTDISNLNKSIDLKREKEVIAEKLVTAFTNNEYKKTTKDIYYYARIMTSREAFAASDGAVTQLQNSGGYSMIKNKLIIDQINRYHYLKEKIYKLNDTEDLILIEYRKVASKLFKADVFSKMLNANKYKTFKYYIKPLDNNVPLFLNDKALINELLFWISSENGNQSASIAQMVELKSHVKVMIETIELHIK